MEAAAVATRVRDAAAGGEVEAAPRAPRSGTGTPSGGIGTRAEEAAGGKAKEEEEEEASATTTSGVDRDRKNRARGGDRAAEAVEDDEATAGDGAEAEVVAVAVRAAPTTRVLAAPNRSCPPPLRPAPFPAVPVRRTTPAATITRRR